MPLVENKSTVNNKENWILRIDSLEYRLSQLREAINNGRKLSESEYDLLYESEFNLGLIEI